MSAILKLDVMVGDEIRSAIFRAIELARQKKKLVEFEFNGVTVRVYAASDLELLYRDWNRAMKGYLGEKPIIGPGCKAELTEAEIASDAAIKAENELKRERQVENWRLEAEAKTKLLQDLLAEAPPMEIKDIGSWQIFVDANQDGYGARTVRYAEEWSRLMQMRLAEGCPISESADETSRIADDDGITGFIHACAASMLIQCWKYGEDLRAWKQG